MYKFNSINPCFPLSPSNTYVLIPRKSILKVEYHEGYKTIYYKMGEHAYTSTGVNITDKEIEDILSVNYKFDPKPHNYMN